MTKLQTALSDFDSALDALNAETATTRLPAQQHLLKVAEIAMDLDGGIAALYERAQKFQDVGVFAGGSWESPAKLLPHLVRGGLLAPPPTAIIEVLSELRMLCLATGRTEHEDESAEAAREFLRKVVVANLSFLSAGATEDSRNRPETYKRGERLISLILEQLSPELVADALIDEIEQLCAQRPILTESARELIQRSTLLAGKSSNPESEKRLQIFRDAIGQPSPLSKQHDQMDAYRDALATVDAEVLDEEIRTLRDSLAATGLGNAYHAVLIRYLANHAPEKLSGALGLDSVGRAALEKHLDFICELIEVAIRPETCESVLGLFGVLERDLMSRRAVQKGFRRLMTLNVHPLAKKSLMARLGGHSSVGVNALLVAGAFSVLGQPLGIGQGKNPTCQSARGLSIWSSHAPGYLINLLIGAARDGTIEFDFEGLSLESGKLGGGLAPNIDPDLDAVSLVLVPHLDRVYDEMMRRGAGRGVDPHRWVNPALYGRWVPNGFACAVNDLIRTVTDYDTFVRRFYATHHPGFNEGDDLSYPNPVGLFVTDVHANLLGAHAVSLRRIEPNAARELRAYFFNPNNEGRQDWGHGVVVSVSGHGEMPGESSLPFAEFVSRLYAFHYHPYEGGELEAVPDEVVKTVTEASKASWGRIYQWV